MLLNYLIAHTSGVGPSERFSDLAETVIVLFKISFENKLIVESLLME
jgi:hypothetical protein